MDHSVRVREIVADDIAGFINRLRKCPSTAVFVRARGVERFERATDRLKIGRFGREGAGEVEGELNIGQEASPAKKVASLAIPNRR